MNFYEPVTLFRQPAIRASGYKSANGKYGPLHTGNRTVSTNWQTNTHNIDTINNSIRKFSNEFNEYYYMSRKLHSNYYDINENNTYTNTMDILNERLLLSTGNNLKLFNIQDNNSTDNNTTSLSLRPLQTVAVPGEPITSATLVDSDIFNNDILLSGHRDGRINLISTNTSESRISKRFNINKYIKSTLPDDPLNFNHSAPINQLVPWDQDNFIATINDSLFIYNLDHSSAPLYLNSFQDLKSLTASPFDNSIVVTLENTVQLLDVRQQYPITLYTPPSSHASLNCAEFLHSHNSLAVGTRFTTDILDLRFANKKNGPMAQCLQLNNVRSLKYDSHNNNLNSLDHFGAISQWDLDYSSRYYTLKSNLAKSTTDIPEAETLATGDIIISDSDITAIGLFNNEHIVSLGFEEVGIHQIIDIRESLGANARRTSSLSHYGETEQDDDVVSWNSSNTLAHSQDSVSSLDIHVAKPSTQGPPTNLYSVNNYDSNLTVNNDAMFT